MACKETGEGGCAWNMKIMGGKCDVNFKKPCSSAIHTRMPSMDHECNAEVPSAKLMLLAIHVLFSLELKVTIIDLLPNCIVLLAI